MEGTSSNAPPIDGLPHRPIASSYMIRASHVIDPQHQAGSLMRELVWVDREGVEHPLTETRGGYLVPRLSLDGRCLLYTANESGQREVYVRPFPGL